MTLTNRMSESSSVQDLIKSSSFFNSDSVPKLDDLVNFINNSGHPKDDVTKELINELKEFGNKNSKQSEVDDIINGLAGILLLSFSLFDIIAKLSGSSFVQALTLLIPDLIF